MYTIIVNDSNELIPSVTERIVQRSKLVNTLHFLVSPTYKSINMEDFTATLEYKLPISHEYKTETLNLSEEKYKDYFEYKLPFDTCLTKEHGKIEVQLTFTKVEMDEEGEITQYVRHTTSTVITVVPLEAWSNLIPDEALTSLDQRLLKVDAQLKQLSDIADTLDDSQVDNLRLSDNKLQLIAKGTPVGDAVDMSGVNSSEAIKNIKVIEF